MSILAENNVKVKAALWYAAKKGWAVIPLHSVENGVCTCGKGAECDNPGKHPRISEWTKNASKDPKQINKWWNTWPDANIGIVTGAISGIIALDVDPRSGGDASLSDLEEKYGSLPETIESITGGGGRHILFKCPEWFVKTQAGELAPGLDIRGDGGMIVAPPSIHASGNSYEWEIEHRPEETELAEIPEWLADMLKSKGDRRSREAKAQVTGRVWKRYLKGGPIQEGTRDNTLYTIGCTMRAHGASYEDILATLIAVNEQRCNPPMDYRTILQKADQAAKHSPGKSGLLYFPTTDFGNAERLVDRHGADIRFCDPMGGWIVWDGKRWVKDETGAVYRMALETIRAYRKEADKEYKAAKKAMEAETDLVKKEELKSRMETLEEARKFAYKSESRSRIEAMVALAQVLPGIPVSPDDFDQHKWILNVENGMIDLKTGKLMPHKREYLITKLAPVTYDPSASAPRWRQFVTEIMNGDEEMANYLKRKIGYSLTGDTSEEDLDIFFGSGANGKSKFIETILTMMGDYGQQAPANLFMQKNNEGSASPEKVRLKGARFVAAVETADGKKMDEAFIKELTGRDRMSARNLWKDVITFHPECKIFLATNHKPLVQGTDNGIWRRIRLIPFEVNFEQTGKKDKHLIDKLLAELPGVLNWALEGLREWLENGLQVPEKVLAATNEYREEMDSLGNFLDECCVQHWSAESPLDQMYKAYVEWCNENGETPMKKRMLSKRLTERGFRQDRNSKGTARVWKGLGLAIHYPSLAQKSTSDKTDKTDTKNDMFPRKIHSGHVLGRLPETNVKNVSSVRDEIAATKESEIKRPRSYTEWMMSEAKEE